MENIYEGFYARFETESKAKGSMLMGPDHLVGDDYEVFFKTEEGSVVAWLRNKFGVETGYFDADASRKLRLAQAKDQTIRAVLALVAYSEGSESGQYWGQMAVFCFNPRYADEINAFADRVAVKLIEGIRPAIDLGSHAVDQVLTEKDWMPTATVPLPKNEAGMAVIKDHQSISEKMIEQGRAGNKGCYFVSILFIVVVIAAIAYGLFTLLA